MEATTALPSFFLSSGAIAFAEALATPSVSGALPSAVIASAVIASAAFESDAFASDAFASADLQLWYKNRGN